MLCVVGVVDIAASCGRAADRLRVMSVCDVISRRSEFSGHVIAVRGEVGVGGHGVWLKASHDCTYKLITQGVVWPNIIHLTYPDNQSSDPVDHAPFEVDWTSLRRADQVALRAGYQAGVDDEVVTYIGLFVTYHDLENRVTPNLPGALRLGFGPPSAPAQLLIKSAKDVVVVRGASGAMR